MSKSLDRVRIVLVEPAGGLNVGSIARVMKNMGLKQLIIVNPRCEVGGEAAMTMAVHAKDILHSTQIVTDLPSALVGCTRVIATTGRDEDVPKMHLETPRQALPWLVESDEPTALIFGREDIGLTNTELNYASRHIRIPVGGIYSSLNLAQAVGICAYELQMCVSNSQDNLVSTPPIVTTEDLATVESLEDYYQQLETLLLKIGYLLPHTASKRMAKIRRLYNRSQLSTNEVALLRGILSQIKWQIDK